MPDTWLPAVENVMAMESGHPTALRDLERRPGSPRARVLIVDDEPMVRAFVEQALCGKRYATTTAADGAEAEHVFARLGPFDLVVIDLRMPDITGTELARRLRQSDPDLNVLYLTGYRDELLAERRPLGPNDALLDKPCTVAGLLDAVTLLLDAAASDAATPSIRPLRERLFEFTVGPDRMHCELIDHGRYGVEAVFVHEGEIAASRTFPPWRNGERSPRALALAWVKHERQAMETRSLRRF
jgi:CheY-like chemotaxis protein